MQTPSRPNPRDATALHSLFHQLQQTNIEDYDQEAYEGQDTDTKKLAWLKDLSSTLQAAVDAKEQQIADLESEVDDLRAVETALATVTHRVKLRLGIDLVEGQLPLPPTSPNTVETGV